MTYPDLISIRRVVLPVLERNEQRLFGRDVMFSKAVQPECFAGAVRDATVDDVRRQLVSVDGIYPANAATMKYHETSGGKAYERGSYALRPDGFLGTYQFHFRLWAHVDGVAITAHQERNPLVRPVTHYRGVEWQPQPGIAKARELLEVDSDASIDGIRP